jgi:hypothetical protein
MGPPVGSAFGSADPGQFFSFDPGELASLEPEFSLPAPSAVFTKGSSTLTVEGTATELSRLAGTAAIYPSFGTDVAWTDGKGMYLRLYGSGDAADEWGMTIDRIKDGNHWTTDDPARCTISVDHADRTGIEGTGSCTAIRWIDTMAAFGAPDRAYVAGQDPFDAEVTFKATP